MKLNLSADELLTTTRSVRKRLDFERPVDHAVVEECLEIALQAPTGGNSQGWHWIVVEDPAKRKALGEIYRTNFAEYASSPRPQYSDLRAAQASRVTESSTYLSHNLHRAPLLLIPAIQGRLENQSALAGAGGWGSLLPAVWSFMLAARERGLGSAWTTLHLMNDGEKQAADVLGIPFSDVTQAGLFPIAYTIGTDFKPAQRMPLKSVLHWDEW